MDKLFKIKIAFVILLFALFLINKPAYCAFYETIVNDANSLYEEGKYDEAIEKYQEALKENEGDPVTNFNIANAFYKKGDYKNAHMFYTKALTSDELHMETMVNYNLGNTFFKQGNMLERDNLEEASVFYDKSLHHYKRAVDLDETDRDAKYNYELARLKLEEVKKKLKEQQERDQEPKSCENPSEEGGESNQQESKQQSTEENLENNSTENSEEENNNKEEQEAGADQEKEQETAQSEDDNKDSSGIDEKDMSASKLDEKKDEQEESSVQKEQIEGVMSPEEARMLLDFADKDELTTREFLKEKLKEGGPSRVLKDW